MVFFFADIMQNIRAKTVNKKKNLAQKAAKNNSDEKERIKITLKQQCIETV